MHQATSASDTTTIEHKPHQSPLKGEAPLVRIRRLCERAHTPRYHSEQAAGMDLCACLPDDEPLIIEPRQIAIAPTGLAMALPPGHEAQIRPRSGLATKHGLTIPNAPGTIDADYRGEIKVALINLGGRSVEIHHGMRIAQMVIAPVSRAAIVEVDDLDETARGTGGFGSTGV